MQKGTVHLAFRWAFFEGSHCVVLTQPPAHKTPPLTPLLHTCLIKVGLHLKLNKTSQVWMHALESVFSWRGITRVLARKSTGPVLSLGHRHSWVCFIHDSGMELKMCLFYSKCAFLKARVPFFCEWGLFLIGNIRSICALQSVEPWTTVHVPVVTRSAGAGYGWCREII